VPIILISAGRMATAHPKFSTTPTDMTNPRLLTPSYPTTTTGRALPSVYIPFAAYLAQPPSETQHSPRNIQYHLERPSVNPSVNSVPECPGS
jgi:hypothetical protein